MSYLRLLRVVSTTSLLAIGLAAGCSVNQEAAGGNQVVADGGLRRRAPERIGVGRRLWRRLHALRPGRGVRARRGLRLRCLRRRPVPHRSQRGLA